MSQNTSTLKIKHPRWSQRVFTTKTIDNIPVRYRVAHGGRGSSKSWEFARRLLIEGAKRKIKVLCAREIQNSIKASAHSLLVNQTSLIGLDKFYDCRETTIKGANGTEIIYSGLLRNIDSVRSMEGIDICWIEEANKVSKASWRVLIPTIRSPGSEIWATFNRDDEDDEADRMFVTNRVSGAVVQEVNYWDNPWFPDELRAEMEYLKRVDYESYLHVWEGHLRTQSDAQIFKGKYRVDEFEPEESWQGPYFGADWGFSVDPTTLVKMWIYNRCLYIEYESYGVGVEIDKTPAMFEKIPGARTTKIRADNARPETISYIKRQGFNIEAAKKWSGSVEDGIEYLKSFEEIVIHNRCKNTADEFLRYSYKVDPHTEDITIKIVDKNNHCIDAIRYGLEPLISKGISPMTINIGTL